jgi:hypothetical protein
MVLEPGFMGQGLILNTTFANQLRGLILHHSPFFFWSDYIILRREMRYFIKENV